MTVLGVGACATSNRSVASGDEDRNSLHAKYLIFTQTRIDGTKLNHYEFDQVPRNHGKATEHCEDKRLHLTTKDEAFDLKDELEAKKWKLKKWLGGKRSIWVWTSSEYTERSDREWVWLFGAFAYGQP